MATGSEGVQSVNQPYEFDHTKNWSKDPLRYPLVSVILRTYRGDWHLLPRAIASIFAQTLKNIELFVVNDGPMTTEEEDSIEALLASAQFPAFLCGTPTETKYYAFSSNLGIIAARGLYIAHLDADNEWTPDHLDGLLKAIRTPDPESGLASFTYSRRKYVIDPECTDKRAEKFQGDSPLTSWEPENIAALMKSPQANFVDSSEFLIGKGTMFYVATLTKMLWNIDLSRYGDWELMNRFNGVGLRGKAVNQVSLIYHWTGENVQLKRDREGDYLHLSRYEYEELRKRGFVKEGL